MSDTRGLVRFVASLSLVWLAVVSNGAPNADIPGTAVSIVWEPVLPLTNFHSQGTAEKLIKDGEDTLDKLLSEVRALPKQKVEVF